jgi:uncharacterized spore protein YtfJ
MDVEQLIADARDALTVKRVFGEPYEHNGITVLPVAKIQGGGGGGQGDSAEGQGVGGGGGLAVHPAGVYVLTGDRVRWQPAVDVTRIVVGAQVVAVLALLTWRSVATRWLKSRSQT